MKTTHFGFAQWTLRLRSVSKALTLCTMLLTPLLFLGEGLGVRCSAQNIGISSTGATPDNSAMLDVVSSTKGMLIPRMNGTEKYAIPSPATGLLIFQTDTVGFWYYDGTKWIPLISSTSSTASPTNAGWLTTGNIGTAWDKNFLGTTDNVSLRMRTNDTTRMIVDSLGRVGIGTASPAFKLTVQDTSSTAFPFAIYVNSNTAGYGPVVRQFRARGTSTPSQVLSGDYLGGLGAYGYDGSGNYSSGVNSIIFAAAEDFTSATNHGSRMTFYTTSKGAATSTERMRIDTNGYVGIGTTSPNDILHINSPSDAFVSVQKSSITTGDETGIKFKISTNTDDNYYYAGIIGERQSDSFLKLHLATRNGGGALTSSDAKLTIDKNGNVGIGTTSPVTKLHLYSPTGISSINVDQSGTSSTGQAAINFMTLGDGTKWLGNAATLGWTLTARANAFSPASEQNDLQLYYWDGSSWLNRMYWDNAGNVGIGTASPSAKLDISSTTGYNQLRMRTSYTPSASADSNGNTGDIAWDSNYIYIKTAAGWKRSALSTW